MYFCRLCHRLFLYIRSITSSVCSFRLVTAGSSRLGDTVAQVVPEQFPSNTPDRFLHGRDLRQSIGAVAVVFDHFLNPADLPLNPLEPGEIRRF